MAYLPDLPVTAAVPGPLPRCVPREWPPLGESRTAVPVHIQTDDDTEEGDQIAEGSSIPNRPFRPDLPFERLPALSAKPFWLAPAAGILYCSTHQSHGECQLSGWPTQQSVPEQGLPLLRRFPVL